MKFSVDEQLKTIISSLFNKDITSPFISLLSDTYMLEPRDVLLVIYEFLKINNIYPCNIPCWDYSTADLQSLSDYCHKILQLSRKDYINV